MQHILLIDDDATEARLLKARLPESVIIHWVSSLKIGKTLLAQNLYPMALVIVDVVGTTYEDDFVKELETIKNNIIVTSNIMSPIDNRYKFVLKENLIEEVKKELTSLKTQPTA